MRAILYCRFFEAVARGARYIVRRLDGGQNYSRNRQASTFLLRLNFLIGIECKRLLDGILPTSVTGY